VADNPRFPTILLVCLCGPPPVVPQASPAQQKTVQKEIGVSKVANDVASRIPDV